MAKQTIIDWHKNNLIIASCSGRGASVKIDNVERSEFSTEADAASATASQTLVKAASQMGLGKSDVTVVASREIVELRTVSVPKMDADELPDVIRFQAQRQLANMGDNWIVDYVMLPTEPGQEMQTALVGAVSPARLNEINAACGAANLQVSRISLKPIDIARYAIQAGDLSSSGASMVLCLSEQDADLLILKNGHVVLVRGTKLPSDKSDLGKVVGGEMRRSLMAASKSIGGSQIEHVLVIATGALAHTLEPVIAEIVDAKVTTLDPSGLLAKGLEDANELIHSDGNRLAAIAGASLYTPSDKKTSLDFKDPKKRPPKKNKTSLYILAAAASLLLIGAGVSWWYSTTAGLDQELALLKQNIKDNEEVVDVNKKKLAKFQAIEGFLDNSPNFLHELSVVAQKIPASDKVIFGAPLFRVQRNGAEIRVPVNADSAATISEMEDSLRDDTHSVLGSENKQSPRPTPLYKYESVETILVQKAGWKPDFDALVKVVAAAKKDQSAAKPEEEPAEAAAEESVEISESEDSPPVPDPNKRADTTSTSAVDA